MTLKNFWLIFQQQQQQKVNSKEEGKINNIIKILNRFKVKSLTNTSSEESYFKS